MKFGKQILTLPVTDPGFLEKGKKERHLTERRGVSLPSANGYSPIPNQNLGGLGKIRDALKYFKIATFYQNFRSIFRNETEEGHSVQ